MTRAALRERDIEGCNIHGLTGILASPTNGPLPMRGEGLRWLRKQGEDEIAGETDQSVIGTIAAGEQVRLGSGVFSGFLGRFVASTNGGAVGIVSIDLMGSACDVPMPIEDVYRAA